MMIRSLFVFAAVTVVTTWILAGLVVMSKESMGDLAALLFLPAAFIPLILAFIAHRMQGAVGNPFKGLVWGQTSLYFLIWIIAVVSALIVCVVSIGLGMARFDPEMTRVVEIALERMGEQAADLSESQQGVLKIGGYIQAGVSPTIGVVLFAALYCLSTFPWLGWFFRRLLVYGIGRSMAIFLALTFIISMAGGMIPNPELGDISVPVRVILSGLLGVAYAPAVIWIFLKTRSAVLPAIAQGSFQGAVGAAMPFMSDVNSVFAPPLGLTVIAVTAGIGIALWIWKDPGGKDLAVAAVAHDGTPLSPEQVKAFDEMPEPPDGGMSMESSVAVSPPAGQSGGSTDSELSDAGNSPGDQ